MKAKITGIEKINNANIRATIEFLDDNGKVTFKTTRPIMSNNQSDSDVKNYVVENLKNIHSTYLTENSSKLYDSVFAMIGQEIDIS